MRSLVRKLVLGDGDPAASPYNGGWWSAFSVRPYQEAPLLEIMDTCQHIWIGYNAAAIYTIFDGGKMIVLGLASCDAQPNNDYSSRPATEIRKLYQGWPPHLVNAIERMFLDKPEVTAF